ncbi:sigma-70 family RNA polymerase sigma factor [Teredinibacter sp. KSP-S5-2]|uniref:sigma-70 family RNA polymerase sigma factor n=1 Tax=Teredinibacter sp. KSP-S5-2 TaxID=3034506 RepID=UPI002934B5DD|nr:sigma-70 family RNA polymerase sigma factor [Teredinibacter sp. KSP-S5-2]WNO09377.1 sigma-70 family RNA polymerase sigma factor [Teredinibacter sp. KSP-S5-2]
MNKQQNALEEAVNSLQTRLRRYLRKRLSDISDVDDVIQEAFLKALNAQKAGKNIDNIHAWLFAVAKTTLVDLYRSRGVPTEQLEDDLAEPGNDNMQLHQEVALCVRPFIESLPEKYRDTLLATQIEGMSLTEYAQEQGLSVSAIKSRVARARKILKQDLLSCCRIQFSNGKVADYGKTDSGCNGKC